MIAILVMIVIGFTIPGFLQLGSSPQDQAVEPRLCTTDSECYLVCDDVPRKVLCLSNLCAQNSCGEQSLYEFKEQPLSFEVELNVEGKDMVLGNRSRSADLFVNFDKNRVNAFALGLNLNQILEKAGSSLDSNCVKLAPSTYCRGEGKNLTMQVNGVQTYSYGDYVPQQDDKIEITFS